MIQRPKFAWAGIVSTMLAWGCFQGMEVVEDHSSPQTALMIVGYALVAVSLFLFFKAVTQPPT